MYSSGSPYPQLLDLDSLVMSQVIWLRMLNNYYMCHPPRPAQRTLIILLHLVLIPQNMAQLLMKFNLQDFLIWFWLFQLELPFISIEASCQPVVTFQEEELPPWMEEIIDYKLPGILSNNREQAKIFQFLNA